MKSIGYDFEDSEKTYLEGTESTRLLGLDPLIISDLKKQCQIIYGAESS